MKPACCLFSIALLVPLGVLADEAPFKRGDANVDGHMDISDTLRGLGILFLGDREPDCDDVLDTNDDGAFDVSDPISVIHFLFGGGPAPPSPFPECGLDTTPDPLGCAAYSFCALPCTTPSDLLEAIEESIQREVCIPPDSAVAADPVDVTVCPSDEASPCGGAGGLGCPVTLAVADGRLDFAAKRVAVHLEGAITDLTVDIVFLGDETRCTTDITFEGDAVVPLGLSSNPDGSFTVTSLGDPILEDADVNLTAEGGFVCELFEGAQGQFTSDVVSQIEEAAKDLVVELRERFVGERICAE